MFLYHMNVGYPILDEGAELVIAANSVTPVAEYPVEDYRIMTGPTPAMPEQCWEHDVRVDPKGRSSAAVVNERIGLGVYQSYDAAALPFHTTWRMLGEGTYGVALEPTTNRDAGRFDAAERGELLWLAPGETRTYDLEIGVLDGSERIAEYRSSLPSRPEASNDV
jgi:hypothetical protein